VDYQLLATCQSAAHRIEKHTRGLGKHSVVLKLRLPQRRSVASNDDELGLAGSQALEGGLVAKGDPKEVSMSLVVDCAAARTCQTSSQAPGAS
jgi:hypothetical protein